MSCVNRTTFGGLARPRVPTKKWRDSAGRDEPLARPGVRGERVGRRTTYELREPDNVQRTREAARPYLGAFSEIQVPPRSTPGAARCLVLRTSP
jgi:hypothetical protein